MRANPSGPVDCPAPRVGTLDGRGHSSPEAGGGGGFPAGGAPLPGGSRGGEAAAMLEGETGRGTPGG